MLLESGAITADQLGRALAEQAAKGGFLGQILVDLGFLDENSFTSFMAKHCRIPHLSLLDYLIDEDLLKVIPKDLCLKYCVLPIDKMAKNLTVAMVNPLDSKAMDALRAACPDLRIKPILCAYNHYQVVARKLFATKEEKSEELSMSHFGLRRVATKVPEAGEEAKEPAAPAPVPETQPAPVVETEILPPAPAAPAVESAPIAEAPPEPEPEKPRISGEQLLDTIFGATPAAPADERLPAGTVFDPGAFVSLEGDVMEEVVAIPLEEEKQKKGESLLDTIFGKRQETSSGKPSSTSDSSILVREMINVMQESMCDTYSVLARRISLFRGLSPGDVAKIFALGMTTEFDPGTMIFEKGDAGDKLYVILGGKVEISDGEVLIATLSRGDMFGEMALVSNEPRSATAIVIETTSTLLLDNHAIHNVLSKEAAIQLLENIVVTMSSRLRAANLRIEQVAGRPAQAP